RRLKALCEELDSTIDFLTTSLRPAVLDLLGLSPALRTLVRGWSDRFRIAAEYHARGVDALRLQPDVETNVYRIAQEALHNVFKHANASHVTVSLERRGDDVVFIVADNGRGFDVDGLAARTVGGLGIVNMRERAALSGGALEVESAPGNGTTLFVRLGL